MNSDVGKGSIITLLCIAFIYLMGYLSVNTTQMLHELCILLADLSGCCTAIWLLVCLVYWITD